MTLPPNTYFLTFVAERIWSYGKTAKLTDIYYRFKGLTRLVNTLEESYKISEIYLPFLNTITVFEIHH